MNYQKKVIALHSNPREITKDVEALLTSYRHAQIVLKEDEAHLIKRNNRIVKMAAYVVNHIENIIDIMNEREKFILTNIFILGKTGKWHREYFSDSTYYRIRCQAFKIFLIELER